jgi:hypothetical protein
MTTPSPAKPASASPSPTPAGVRIASTLCWVVGVVTILVALAVGIPALATSQGALYLTVGIAAGGAVCVAAVFIRRQRRIGVLIMLGAWALPMVVALVNHQSPTGSFLLLVALLFAGANWKHFR